MIDLYKEDISKIINRCGSKATLEEFKEFKRYAYSILREKERFLLKRESELNQKAKYLQSLINEKKDFKLLFNRGFAFIKHEEVTFFTFKSNSISIWDKSGARIIDLNNIKDIELSREQ